MKKTLLLLVFAVLPLQNLWAQKQLSGCVQDEEGGLPYATVQLTDSAAVNLSTAADERGCGCFGRRLAAVYACGQLPAHLCGGGSPAAAFRFQPCQDTLWLCECILIFLCSQYKMYAFATLVIHKPLECLSVCHGFSRYFKLFACTQPAGRVAGV